MRSPTRRVFITVGTDHHRFDRLIDWVDLWDPPHELDVAVLVQHGASRSPKRFPSVPFLDGKDLREVLETADVVVTQGGPGGIMDSRRAGRRPVVIPRRAKLQEVVDDHQIAFVDHLAALGDIVLARDCQELHAAMTSGVLHPERFRTERAGPTPRSTVEAFAAAVEHVVNAADRGWRDRLPHRPGQSSQPRSRSSKR